MSKVAFGSCMGGGVGEGTGSDPGASKTGAGIGGSVT